jgi:putative peptidoglycan lipid II flippase
VSPPDGVGGDDGGGAGSDPAGPDAATSAAAARRSSALVAGGILLSRIAGLARERVIANYMGVGPAVDAFRAALRIPNLLQNLLGEGVLSASFIPVYARLVGRGDDEEAGRVAGAVAGLLAAVAGALVVVGVVFARPLAVALTPGYTGERLDLTVTLIRILTPGVGFLVLSAWCLGVLNSHRRFFLPYVAPVLWNAAQIAVLVALGVRGTGQRSLAVALAWGTFAGGALQLAVQLPAVRAVAGRVRLSIRTDLAGVRQAVRQFVPVVAGRGVVQLSSYVDLFLASFLAVGAVSALGYAQIFYLLPISLFGMSVAAAELPELSRLGGEDRGRARSRIDAGLARIAFFVVPAAVAYVVLGDFVVGALLRTGRFGVDQTRLVWYVLVAYTGGLVATTSGRLMQNSLYAMGDARTPAVAAAARVAVAAVVGVVLMFQLDRVVIDGAGIEGLERIADLPVAPRPLAEALRTSTAGSLHLGAVGLALGAGVSAWVELGLLRRRVRAVLGPVRVGGGYLGRTALAALAAGAVALVIRPMVDGFHPVLALGGAGVPAGVAYVLAARALGVPEAAELAAFARRRRW